MGGRGIYVKALAVLLYNSKGCVFAKICLLFRNCIILDFFVKYFDVLVGIQRKHLCKVLAVFL